MSLLIWPILNAISTYYVYQSFDITLLNKFGITGEESLLIFIFSGIMGYNCFWAMVQSARYIRNERENGTIEMIFLTPANRLAIVYGRAMGGIVQNIWMFLFFITLIGLLYNNLNVVKVIYIVLAFIIMLISSVVWGGLINALFLISRDTDFLFTICDSPMELLSGVRIPINAFPTVIRYISCVFPLTFCLAIIREIFINNCISFYSVGILFSLLITLCVITIIVLQAAERHNRITGGFQLY